jgi:hypothetical protein
MVATDMGSLMKEAARSRPCFRLPMPVMFILFSRSICENEERGGLSGHGHEQVGSAAPRSWRDARVLRSCLLAHVRCLHCQHSMHCIQCQGVINMIEAKIQALLVGKKTEPMSLRITKIMLDRLMACAKEKYGARSDRGARSEAFAYFASRGIIDWEDEHREDVVRKKPLKPSSEGSDRS